MADITSIAVAGIITLSGMLADKSAEYRDGFCAGYQMAVEQSQQNRDHFMRMDSDFPFETQDEAIKRIYDKPWDEQHKAGTIVHQIVSVERDAVDLYVVLPSTKMNCK